MKKAGAIILFTVMCLSGIAQEIKLPEETTNEGRLYIYWGWNRAWYSDSDISFTGEGYDFTLEKVEANDRPSPFDAKVYFNPTLLTIPQYNLRIGYFINEHYNISVGMDHMKYVMVRNQTVNISGEIKGSESGYDGDYDNDEIVLRENFLKFEHTDGLNYGNIEIRRFDDILAFGNIKISVTEGIGGGILYPKTNSTLLGKDTYDEFHLAGYGVAGIVGINFNLFKSFFIQPEFKAGYINMPDIRTTPSESDKASQSFTFTQFNVVFGASFNLKKN